MEGGGKMTLQRNWKEGGGGEGWRWWFRQEGTEICWKHVCTEKASTRQQLSSPPRYIQLAWHLVKCGRTSSDTGVDPACFEDYRQSVFSLFVFFKVVRHSRALPCTRERSARRWCCQRSRTLSPPRWRKSRSCRRRPRGSSPAGSPRSRPTQQRRDLSATETFSP